MPCGRELSFKRVGNPTNKKKYNPRNKELGNLFKWKVSLKKAIWFEFDFVIVVNQVSRKVKRGFKLSKPANTK